MKNEYVVTWQLYRTWLWENMRKPLKCVFSVIWVAFAIWSISMYLALRISALLIFVVFGLYRAFFRDLLLARKQYNRLVQSYGGANWTRTISFEEDRIVSTDEQGRANTNYQTYYSEIAQIKEKGNKVWLILKDKMVIRLYKDKFSSASWEECRTFITEKMSS